MFRASRALRVDSLRNAGIVDTQVLASLDARLATLRDSQRDAAAAAATAAEENARAEAAAAADATIADWLERANQRVATGRLIAPANDNARFYFESVLTADPGNSTARQGLTFVSSMLLADARTALAQGDAVRARPLLQAADELGASRAQLEELEAQLGSLTEQTAPQQRQEVQRAPVTETPPPERASPPQTEQPPRQTLTDALAELTPPSNPVDSVATIESGSETVTERSALPVKQNEEFELVKIRTPAPRYPANALRRGVEGWVDVEFLVLADGTTSNVTAVASEPGSTFDRAAVTAGSDWRYEALPTDDPNASQRARVRLDFTLRDN
ncbi:MAG: TonB family protein [Pseudomonadota bacterium]